MWTLSGGLRINDTVTPFRAKRGKAPGSDSFGRKDKGDTVRIGITPHTLVNDDIFSIETNKT